MGCDTLARDQERSGYPGRALTKPVHRTLAYGIRWYQSGATISFANPYPHTAYTDALRLPPYHTQHVMNPGSMQPARMPQSVVPYVYTAIAPTHDWLAVWVEAKARAFGLQQLDVQNGEHVLEVAVGTGLSFPRLVAANPDGWTEGLDRTPAMLRAAAKRMQNAPHQQFGLRLGDAYALPYPENTFDAVLNSYMFDMLPVADFQTVLREFRRVLKPGGRCVCINMTVPTHWSEQLWDTIYAIFPPLLGGCRGITLAPSMREAGFVDVQRTRIVQRTFPSEVVVGQA